MIASNIKSLRISKKQKLTKKSPLEDIIVCNNLKLIMNLRRKTLSGLAEESGLDIFTIKRARKSKLMRKCKLKTLVKIASALDVKIDHLFTLVNSEGEERCLKAK